MEQQSETEGRITGSGGKRQRTNANLKKKKNRESQTKAQWTQRWNKGLLYRFCIPYFSVHALGKIFVWVHNGKALSATLKLIKRKQIHWAPGGRNAVGGQQERQCRRRGIEYRGCGWILAVWSALVTHSLSCQEASNSSSTYFILPLFLLLWRFFFFSPTSFILLSRKNSKFVSVLSTRVRWCIIFKKSIWSCILNKDLYFNMAAHLGEQDARDKDSRWDERGEQWGHQMSGLHPLSISSLSE